MTQPKAKSAPPARDRRAVIYVVDDEPMLLELAMVILTAQEFKVETFRDPQAALEAFEKAEPKPALVISDYAMHQMNGLGLLEACRQIEPRQKLVLVSGTVDASVYADSTCKPDRFLAKPYEPEQLVKLVTSLLGR